MALGTNHQGATELAVFIPEIWGSKVNEFYRSRLVFGNFFTDRSEDVMDGGDTIYTPNTQAGSANNKQYQTAVVFNKQVETTQTLVINVHKETSFLVEDKEAAQVKRSYSIQEKYMKDSAYVTAKTLETSIGELFSAFSNSNGDSSTALQDSNILHAISQLETDSVMDLGMDGDANRPVAFFMHPTVFWRQLQAIDKFSVAQNSPSNDPTARIPKHILYGFPVFVSPNVPVVDGAYQNILAHEDAIHWASGNLPIQMAGQSKGEFGVRLTSAYHPEWLGTQITADLLYGVVENRDNAGFLLKTSS